MVRFLASPLLRWIALHAVISTHLSAAGHAAADRFSAVGLTVAAWTAVGQGLFPIWAAWQAGRVGVPLEMDNGGGCGPAGSLD